MATQNKELSFLLIGVRFSGLELVAMLTQSNPLLQVNLRFHLQILMVHMINMTLDSLGI